MTDRDRLPQVAEEAAGSDARKRLIPETMNGQACAHTLDWSHRLFDDPTDQTAGS